MAGTRDQQGERRAGRPSAGLPISTRNVGVARRASCAGPRPGRGVGGTALRHRGSPTGPSAVRPAVGSRPGRMNRSASFARWSSRSGTTARVETSPSASNLPGSNTFAALRTPRITTMQNNNTVDVQCRLGPPSARPRAVHAVTTRRRPYRQVAAPDTGAGAGSPIRRDGADSGGEGLCRLGAAWMSVAGTDQPGSEARVAGTGHPTRNPRLASLFGRPVFHSEVAARRIAVEAFGARNACSGPTSRKKST